MVALGVLTAGAITLPLVAALQSHIALDLPTKHFIQRQYTPPIDRAEAVIDTFRVSWDGYYKYAFPHDELKPVTNGFSDSRNGWGASTVDALSTALIMGQKDIVNQIITYIPHINWSQTNISVSLFETTIRYLGGMLSGYDLLSGPLADLADNQADVDALLTQSINLANNLSYAFETPSGVPWNNLFFNNRSNDGSPNGLATVGTLILEWTRLADLSGNSTYISLVNKAESYLLSPSPASSEPFPGLLGMNISPENGTFLDAVGGWIGGADSFYEYLIKMYIYDPSRYAALKDRWIVAADSTIKYLTSHPAPRPDLTFVAQFNGTTLDLTSQHLACFDGGNFILAGQVLGEEKYIAYGLDLVNGCHDTYTSTATHIGPEEFSWDPSSVPANQSAFFNKTGFYITSPQYVLRPEVIESYYYAYRATSDTKYQDWAWDAFVAINATTRVGSGYSSINDVNVVGGGGWTDFQESFWFAEVLKYSFLIQSDQGDEWQVGRGGRDGWVFNTEAHPVRVVGG
ncbi:glycoside hydrolase [Setomelanomma holmii]|uniref:alpha-1,2-Mannosidase n=1 Tax=Setomelanomma holmii TaxID=210430 RepID=A0A9P4H7X7_9PLEO|nr:glycoside hydrolase [Setomelanomma holmii]